MSIGEKIVEKLIEGEVSINKLLDSDVWPCIVASKSEYLDKGTCSTCHNFLVILSHRHMWF